MQKLVLDALILKGPRELDPSLKEEAIAHLKKKKLQLDAQKFVEAFYKLWHGNALDLVKREDPLDSEYLIVIAYKDNAKNYAYKMLQLLLKTELDQLFGIL